MIPGLVLGGLLAAASAQPAPGPASAPAAAPALPPAKPRVLAGVDVELKTQDGWTLKAKYEAAKSTAPTFILLHGYGERKEIWYFLARRLAKSGFGYLAIDLRGHGESGVGPDGHPAPWRKFRLTKTENAYADMTLDVAAGVAYLSTQGVAEDWIGFIGTDVGGSIAIKYAAVHPKVPMVVMLSPGTHYEEVLTVNAIRAYKARPVLMVYSELDRASSRDTPVLYAFARLSAGERNATVISVPKIHGIKLPVNGPVIRQIDAWLKNPVKPEAPPAASTETTPAEGTVEITPFTGVGGSSETLEEGLPPEAPLPEAGQ